MSFRLNEVSGGIPPRLRLCLRLGWSGRCQMSDVRWQKCGRVEMERAERQKSGYAEGCRQSHCQRHRQRSCQGLRHTP